MTDNLTYIEAMAEDEVFLVTGDEDVDDGPTYFYGNMDDVEEYLKTLHASMDGGTRVLHGSLTLAEYLPTDFRGRTAFVVVRNFNDPMSAAVVESGSSTPGELAEEIENLVAMGHTMATIPDIDDIFIFYGYELSVCLSVSWDDVDEETVDTCNQVAMEVDSIKKKLEEEQYRDGD